MLNAKGGFWQAKEKGILRLLCSGGVWSRDRLHAAGYLDSPACMCEEPDSVQHMIWECQYLREFRDTYHVGDAIHRLKEQSPNVPLWTTC